jgi:hypothetical protein
MCLRMQHLANAFHDHLNRWNYKVIQGVDESSLPADSALPL